MKPTDEEICGGRKVELREFGELLLQMEISGVWVTDSGLVYARDREQKIIWTRGLPNDLLHDLLLAASFSPHK